MRYLTSTITGSFRRQIAGALAFMCLGPATTAAGGFTTQEQQRLLALNESLALFDRDYRVQLGEFSIREKACLSKFISASCLDDLRRDAAQARRQYELAKELLRRDLRQIEADVRFRQRREADAARSDRLGKSSTFPPEPGPFPSGKVRLD
jgi:hypothetical protein